MEQQTDQHIEELLSPEQLASGWPWKIFLTMFAAFGAVTLSYVGMTLGYKPYLQNRIDEVATQIDDLAKSLPLAEQQKFLKFYSQIVNMKALLESHVNLEKLFALLEKNTHQRVVFDGLQFDSSRRELLIDGTADSYNTLAQQLQAFDQSKDIEKYLVQQSRIVEGKVKFRLTATVSENILK